MSKTLQTRTMQKIDTSANWAKATSFVPLKGEICVYSDTNQMKIGDNITPINDLSFASTPIYYIEGTGTTDSDGKVSDWTGDCQGIKTYFPGLMIAYKIGVAGGTTTTTLNLNNLGAITVVKNASSAISTNFPVNSIIILIYTKDDDTAYWKIADYDANTNTQVRVYRNAGSGYYPFIASYTTASATGNTSNNKSYEGAYGKIAHNNSYNMFINVANGAVSPWNTITRGPLLNTASITDFIPGPGFNNAVHNIVHNCSYVDEVLEYPTRSNFPTTGESGKIYIALDTNKVYRWSGTTYVEISSSLALGTTNSTAARGDHKHTGTLNMSEISVGASYTPTGTISKISHTPAGAVTASFTGTANMTTNSVEHKPAGTISKINHTHTVNVTSSFSGTAATISSSYTPAGTISKPSITVTPSKVNVSYVNSVGTLPSATFNAGTLPSATLGKGTLPSATFNAGTLPSATFSVAYNSTSKTVNITHTFSAGTLPSHTFNAGTLPSLTFNAGTLPSLTFNAGTLPTVTNVSVLNGASAALAANPAFTGTAGTATASYTPAGTVTSNASTSYFNNTPTFTGTSFNHSHTYTPAGSINASFSGTAFNVTPTFTGTSTNIVHTFTPSGSVTISTPV